MCYMYRISILKIYDIVLRGWILWVMGGVFGGGVLLKWFCKKEID